LNKKVETLQTELNFMETGRQNLRFQILNRERFGISKAELSLIRAQLASMDTGCAIIKARMELIEKEK